jgi:sodium/hydrogen exchanger 8
MGLGLGEPAADYGSIAAVGLFVALMCVCIVAGHLLEENRWMNESTTALLIVSPLCFSVAWVLDARWFYCAELQGLGTGTVIMLASSGKHSRLLVFSEDLFFIYLLPPIIFNAGYVVFDETGFRPAILI